MNGHIEVMFVKKSISEVSSLDNVMKLLQKNSTRGDNYG